MIETLISSKTRIKLLLKFFFNSSTTGYLRGLSAEFGESSNAIRVELNKLEHAGMLTSHSEGNKKMFRANIDHPLYNEIHSILLKYIGFDKIIDDVIERMGRLEKVYVIGDLSKGKNSKVIDLLFIGDIDKNYLLQLSDKVENLIKKKIRYLIYSQDEVGTINWDQYDPKPFLLWEVGS